MQHRVTVGFAAAVLICLIPVATLALEPYSQNFESLIQMDPDALATDGWLVFGNVSTPGGTYLYGYGPFPAPNGAEAFCAIDLGQGGPEQGDQVLVVYSDYKNTDHAFGNIVESNVFQEQIIGPDDVGLTWTFSFNAKLGNIEGGSTAAAFIKTLDPNAGHALTNFITEDMTSIPITWSYHTLSITIDPSLDGQLLQIGFLNTATYHEGSGIFYDNVDFSIDSSVPVETTTWGRVKSLYR